MRPFGDAAHRRIVDQILASEWRIVGIQGIQGSGKTYAAQAVVDMLRERGVRAETVSLDDFYLTRAEMGTQTVRGPPGTHDLPLLGRVLDAVTHRRREPMWWPTYDKAAHGGLGDRGAGRLVECALDVLIVEGWCIGFRPLYDGTATDAHVEAYEMAITHRLDGMVVLVAPARMAYEWRRRAERERLGDSGMRDDAVRAFVDEYMPIYDKYLPQLHRCDGIHVLKIHAADSSAADSIPSDGTAPLVIES